MKNCVKNDDVCLWLLRNLLETRNNSHNSLLRWLHEKRLRKKAETRIVVACNSSIPLIIQVHDLLHKQRCCYWRAVTFRPVLQNIRKLQFNGILFRKHHHYHMKREMRQYMSDIFTLAKDCHLLSLHIVCILLRNRQRLSLCCRNHLRLEQWVR